MLLIRSTARDSEVRGITPSHYSSLARMRQEKLIKKDATSGSLNETVLDQREQRLETIAKAPQFFVLARRIGNRHLQEMCVVTRKFRRYLRFNFQAVRFQCELMHHGGGHKLVASFHIA